MDSLRFSGTPRGLVHTAYLYRSFQFEQDRLIDEDLAGSRTQVLDLMLLELDGFARSITPYCFVSGECCRVIIERVEKVIGSKRNNGLLDQ